MLRTSIVVLVLAVGGPPQVLNLLGNSEFDQGLVSWSSLLGDWEHLSEASRGGFVAGRTVDIHNQGFFDFLGSECVDLSLANGTLILTSTLRIAEEKLEEGKWADTVFYYFGTPDCGGSLSQALGHEMLLSTGTSGSWATQSKAIDLPSQAVSGMVMLRIVGQDVVASFDSVGLVVPSPIPTLSQSSLAILITLLGGASITRIYQLRSRSLTSH